MVAGEVGGAVPVRTGVCGEVQHAVAPVVRGDGEVVDRPDRHRMDGGGQPGEAQRLLERQHVHPHPREVADAARQAEVAGDVLAPVALVAQGVPDLAGRRADQVRERRRRGDREAQRQDVGRRARHAGQVPAGPPGHRERHDEVPLPGHPVQVARRRRHQQAGPVRTPRARGHPQPLHLPGRQDGRTAQRGGIRGRGTGDRAGTGERGRLGVSGEVLRPVATVHGEPFRRPVTGVVLDQLP
ncbi:hypothetical protein GCM10023263_46970 [Phytohabitans rumicis]